MHDASPAVIGGAASDRGAAPALRGGAASERVHGGLHAPELRALALRPEQVLDFSVNINPYGPAPAVARAIAQAAFERYPDPRAADACTAIAEMLGLPADHVLLGHGAVELLWSAARALLAAGATALIVEPAFSEFRAAALACGAQIVQWRAREQDGFAVDLAAVAHAVEHSQAQVVHLCAPSTPAGTAVAVDHIAAAAASSPRTTWVLDQSFLSLSTRFADASCALPPNVLRVCSLTKDHAIPGVRVGYAAAAPALLDRLEAQRSAWSTGAHAQAAAVAACGAGAFVADSRARLLEDRARIAVQLQVLGLRPTDGCAPYLLVKVGDASRLRARLLAHHGVLVRDCASFGLPEFIRVAARPAVQSARLIAALEQELSC